ncbi:LamG-like jellyroll fold domain-containing protein [uncultured Polaribacter sp.]|uniref:DUF7483 domain-containing protein n=1 Tax=uncultured Polaribacter sp. TaxID=174711 RepID=UPI00259B493B|nr:LamG-like jellyroll fold domain-containing protein [uncultured Polaribacter sp.]
MSNTKIKAGQFSGIVGNGTDGYFLMTNGDGTMAWEPAGAPSPTVTSVTYPGDDTAADPAGGQSVTLTGTNFASGATATIGGTTVPSVSFVSATELTITTPAKTAGDYDIVVTNTDGGTATFVDGISYNGIPSWTTASGSLGTFASDTTVSTIALQASEPDAGTITFNITSGALPTGLSLTGADIDGTTSIETADTLYNFTVTAIDDENQSTPRAFSITVEKWVVPAPENFEIVTYTGNGGTQAITSKIGKAASFNGSSSYIDVNKKIPESLNFSFSFWFQTTSTATNQYIFSTKGNSATNGWWIQSDSGTIRYGEGNGSANGTTQTSPASTYADGSWHHAVVTRAAGGTVNMYIDGGQVITNGSVGSNYMTSYVWEYDLHIGRYAGSALYYYNGKLDQIRVFDKVLSSSEVTTLYNESNTSTTKSTTDIFDDGSGVALYELDGDANDTGTGPYGTGAIDSGQSAVFNGSSSRVNLSSNPINGLTSVSFSFWLKPANISSYQYVLSFINSVDGWNGVGVRVSNTGKINIVRANNGAVTSTENSTSTLQLNVWQHIAVTVSQSSTVIYLDGSEDGTFSSTPFTTNNTGSFDIGMNEYSPGVTQAFTEGSIDQVRIYSGILSASNVEALTSETNVPTANLVAHYKLDGNANDETTNYNGTASNVTYSDPAEFPLIQYNGTPTNVNFLGMAFQPDLVWLKCRTVNGRNHRLFDSVRGATKAISSDLTAAEYTELALTSFDTNGFTLGSAGNQNNTSENYVAWCWKAGGAAVSNTDGTITSQVSANTDAGFSVVSYTGNGTAGATVGHGIDTPELILVKNLDDTDKWAVYNSTVGATKFLSLNETTAAVTSSAYWNNTSPTSTTFTIGATSPVNSPNTENYIAYCFHSVDGYQKIGSYTMNGSTLTIDVGFEPRFVLLKEATRDAGWVVVDNVRSAGGNYKARLYPNVPAIESTGQQIQFIGNTFVINYGSTGNNATSGTGIYLAIA